MSTRLERLFTRSAGQRRRRTGLLLAGVIAVPLLVAGFFAGALSNADKRIDTIPAMVVNHDTMVTTTAANGTKQQILAGRQLVTQLTGPNAAGFAWTISSTKDAQAALAAGKVYAVLTIPSDFSKSIQSISGISPKQADLNIRTDDAHGYLAGSAAQAVGTAMSSAFGREITSRYLDAFYQNLAGMGGSLSTAAAGASKISTGIDGLATGLGTLSSGAASASTGASQLAGGVAQYTGGVDQLSAGLGQLNSGAGALSQLSSGIGTYTSGVSSLAAALAQANAGLHSVDPIVASESEDAIAQISAQLTAAANGGTTLSSQARSGISGIQGGIAQSASGAAQISAGSSALRSGANGLAGGVSELSSGTASAASGASQLTSGASQLATGLAGGAEQASALKGGNTTSMAKVVSDPVGVTVSKDNPINTLGGVIGMLFVPVGLWIGAMAIFLLLKRVSALALASTASNGRIVLRGVARAVALALAQAVVLVALLHTALGVTWALLPATLAFSMLLAVVFAALHYLLTVAFGRVGIMVSILLLALQLTVVGGLFPVEIVASPFQFISPLLPLTYAVQGMQGIVSGVGGGDVAGSAAVLILFAAASLLLSFLIVARKRGARAFGFALARG
ncbi:MAG: putative rane protein [Microbacteriaceae bacterium]|nr:putative rane protein [Microbacteriaceae bacterium]